MEREKEIVEMRREIDEIDRRILRLLRRRFEAVERIGEVKKALGAAVEDAEREKDVLENCLGESGGVLDKTFIERFTTLVLEESKKIQRS